MEFTVSKADLVRELSFSQGVVEKKTTIPILSNVLLEASGDRVVLTATDLELGIRSSCPASVKREGSGTIPAKRLADYVRLLPDGDLTIKFLENHWASLTLGRSRTRMAGMSRESYPELPEMPEVGAELPAGVLAAMVARTAFAITAEESRFALNGALLLVRSQGATMVATDGHRLAFVESCAPLESVARPFRVLIPRKAMAEVGKLAQEAGADTMVQIGASENHLFFRLGERLLISRKLSGTFPDYERVLPRDKGHVILLNRDDLRGTIERVAQFADERSRSIRLQLSGAEMRIFTASADTGESEETLAVEYDGADIDIGFNAQYMVDFLRVTSQAQIALELKDSKSAGELRPAGDDGTLQYRYVVMPMRT
jgi:DNA polymerase III subunit beta